MSWNLVILSFFFLLMLIPVFLRRIRKSERMSPSDTSGSDESFFLLGRKMSTAVLLISTAATNFSAFTILGLSGAGYRLGYAFYPVMAFGTGFMALGMYLVGSPLGKLGRERGYISSVDFITDRYDSPLLSKVYSSVLVVLTMPYLALQPMAAGIILESFFGVPYAAGVILSTAIVGIYTAGGGMRAVARTDLFQGVIILLLASAAYLSVLNRFGGFSGVHQDVLRNAPRLLDRFGGGSGTGPAVLAGYIVLWFFADPMFPQLNQRFLAAKNGRALKKTVIMYPLITMVLFFLTISTGVLGAGIIPGLSSSESDKIWPVLIAKAAGGGAAAVFMMAPLAAIMSTLDSQLLSLSSIITRDLMGRKETGQKNLVFITALIAAAGLIIALFPPENILEFINKSSFLGFAALAPLVFGGLYGKRINSAGALFSVAAGEGLVLLYGTGAVSSGDVPAVFPVCGVSWLALKAGSEVFRLISKKSSPLKSDEIHFPVFGLREILPVKWAVLFISIFVLSLDFFNYYLFQGTSPLLSGLPGWMYYQAGLCILLSLLFFLFFRVKYFNKRGVNN